MKIALIGPTGFVGSNVLREASDRGHSVTAICRHPERVPDLVGVTPRQVDITDRTASAAAMAGHDIVVSCFNPGHAAQAGQNIYKDTIEGAANIIRAVKLAKVRRLLFVGGAGALLVGPDQRLIDLLDEVRAGGVGLDYDGGPLSKLPPGFVEAWEGVLPPDTRHEQVLPFVRTLMFFEHDTTYDWSFFSPPAAMCPGPRTGKYVLGGNQLPMAGGGLAGLSLADAGVAIVDEIEAERHSRKHWTAYYPE